MLAKRLSIETIAEAIRVLRPSGSRVYIYVDGLAKTKRGYYKTGLRKLNCSVRKVNGIQKDENEPLIRFADAVAGALRDLLEYEGGGLREILDSALQQGTLVEF